MPKLDHHALTGKSDDECCEKTCELWTCTGGFLTNEVYFGNIGSSDQYCCDKQCGEGFSCDEEYAVNALVAGTTHDACCLPRCSLFSCPEPWGHDKNLDMIVSSKKEDCCAPYCGLFNCSAVGKLQDETKLNVTANTTDACCTQYCSDIECPSGWAVPEELAENVVNTSAATCCYPTCKAHKCGKGWAPSINKSDDWMNTDEDCCNAKCSRFNCSSEEGYVSSPLLADVIGEDSETCCEAQCKLWTCNESEGWYTPIDNEKDNTTGQTNSECCVRPCSFTECPAGQAHITGADTTVLRDTTRCCEDARCDFFRSNLTQMKDGEYCNTLPADDSCDMMYQNRTLEVNGTNDSVPFFVRCELDPTYGICRYATGKNATDCRAS